ncbi:hypothetical protein BHYA_0102g00140 [Botrytis hyacinthi]|uniref:Uncharacterized protein n=1 Tax=Botrytis hyacinthi TaxID=278943 RepID=A0A4Z1GR92_9HELO|nr:hypothetical protein BHYA_0102g00140 [Botrytis hyacinthi]
MAHSYSTRTNSTKYDILSISGTLDLISRYKNRQNRAQQAYNGFDYKDAASQAVIVVFLFILMLSLSNAVYEAEAG